jgi:hypothetical protein
MSERDNLEDVDLDGIIILRRLFSEWDEALTELIWFRLGTGG